MNIVHITVEDNNGGRETVTFHRHTGWTKRDLGEEILEQDLLPFSGEKVWQGMFSTTDLNSLTPEEIAFALDVDDVATFVNAEFDSCLHESLHTDESTTYLAIGLPLRILAETVGITFKVKTH